MIRLLLALMTALTSVPSFAQEGGRFPRGGERGGERGAERGGHRELPRREAPRELPRREEPRRDIPREIPRREEPRRELPRRETPRRPGHRLPRPPQVGGGLDGRREHDRDVRFPAQPGHRQHQDRWGRRLPPSREHITVINNTTIVNNIRVHERNWDRHHHHGYEYHYWNGHRIGHHYDLHNRHWWGFYIGSVYFWTRFHHDHYWWYDPYYRRWVYLHEGRWWYRDPANVTVVYVYDNGRYYNYRDARGGVVLLPDPTPPAEPIPSDPAAPTAPETDKEVYVSEDGTREVRIVGEERDAFLYDTAETPSFEPEYLASDVKEVVFNTATDGALQIMLVVEKTVNGQVERSFRVFDAQGDDLLAPQTPDEGALRDGSEAFRQLETDSIPR